ncbi:hypothetical protein L6164_013837 [Bauhinia variegata]|uniref:Uncharacterized protein n=1 Tax=Bauhinia variegata TaxID=167791 RepID=A0ACB9NG72_BAUVA|nr:hypothetical protein L6164_013837 [Bauhinia variegata]
MEGISKALGKFSGGNKSTSSSSESLTMNGSAGAGEAMAASSSLSPPDSSLVLATRTPRQMVPLRTCLKLCAFCFIAGVFFGFTLKRRVKSWASKLLKRLKDN